jgi:hypothetical protein
VERAGVVISTKGISMVSYDPAVIQSFAERLYKKARQVIATWTLLGVIVGAVIGFVMGGLIGTAIKSASGQPIVIATGVGAVLLGLFGYSVGVERAFHLKLKAQLALCQLMTEANTRQARGMGQQPARPDVARAA